MLLSDDVWLEWHEYPLSWSLLSRCPWLPSLPSLTEFPRSSWWILISLNPTLYFIVTGHFTQPVPLYPLKPCMITIDRTSDEWTTTTKRPRHRLTFKLHAHIVIVPDRLTVRVRRKEFNYRQSSWVMGNFVESKTTACTQHSFHTITLRLVCKVTAVEKAHKHSMLKTNDPLTHSGAFSDRLLLFWLVIDVKAIFHNGKSSEGPFTKWINNTTSWAAAHKKKSKKSKVMFICSIAGRCCGAHESSNCNAPSVRKLIKFN